MSFPVRITCVVPCYNERERIFHVLSELCLLKNLHEIICVDDGSHDGTADFIREKFPQVSVLQLPHNQGKTSAVHAGVQQSHGEYVLLIDADLKGFQASDIANTFPFIEKNQLDMIIFRRSRAPWFLKMRRSDVLLSGERLIRKTDLLTVLQQDVSGFQLEMALNWYMYIHQKSCYWAPSQALNSFKFEKRGFFKGIRDDIHMYWDLLSQKKSVFKFWKLFLNFSKKSVFDLES